MLPKQEKTTIGGISLEGLSGLEGGSPALALGVQMGAAGQEVRGRERRSMTGSVGGSGQVCNQLPVAEHKQAVPQSGGGNAKVKAPAKKLTSPPRVKQVGRAVAAKDRIGEEGSKKNSAKKASAPLAAISSIAAAATLTKLQAAVRAAQKAQQAAPRHSQSRSAAKELVLVLHPICLRCGNCPVVDKRKDEGTEGHIAGEAGSNVVEMVCCPGGGGSLPAIQEITDSSSKQLTWRVDPSQAPLRGAVDAYYCLTCFDELKGLEEEDRRLSGRSGKQPGGAQALGDVVVSSSAEDTVGVGGGAAAEVGGTCSREGGAPTGVVLPAGSSNAVVKVFQVVSPLEGFSSTLRRPPFVSAAVSMVASFWGFCT
jgi:hypothetical protein